MRSRPVLSLLLSLLPAVACEPPRAAPTERPVPTQVEGFIRDLRALPVTLSDGRSVELDALVTRPAGPGPFPLVVLTHGTSRVASERATLTPTRFARQSLAFARHGYAAVAILRRGFGETEGPYAESSGVTCNDRSYLPATRASADDVVAAIHALDAFPWVDPEHVLVVGVSTGGFAALATGATNPKGVVGVISFAGGRGSDVPDHVCRPDRLVAAARDLGTTARVPSLWIYARNDHYFSPVLAQQMAEAYVSGGAPAELVLAPPFGDDGHLLFALAPDATWWDLIRLFLAKIGLPTEVVTPQPAPTLVPPEGLSEAGRRDFFRYAWSEGYEKAFAAGRRGWAWVSGRRSREEARQAALAQCSAHGDGCSVYAVGNAYAK